MEYIPFGLLTLYVNSTLGHEVEALWIQMWDLERAMKFGIIRRLHLLHVHENEKLPLIFLTNSNHQIC